MMRIDARIPVRFGPVSTRKPAEAVLLDREEACSPPAERFVPDAGHQAGCVCCTGRSAAALALAGLFRQRAVSNTAPFTGVVADVGAGGAQAVRDALAQDPLVSGRFRLA